MRIASVVLAVACVAPPASAQRADDVGSVDAIIAALYDVISGPAGQPRDWDRFRALFAPGAHLIPVARRQNAERDEPIYYSVEDYIERSGPILEDRGFFEREIGRVEERFQNIVHAFSTYESRTTSDGPPIQRGINSIQLMYDGQRFWVVNIMWRGVGPDVEIPPRYRRQR